MKRAKRLIRWLLGAVTGGPTLIQRRDERKGYAATAHRLSSIGSTDGIFLHHYQTNEWGSVESASGPGSTMAYTRNIRAHIPALVSDFNVKVFLDAPCGDFNWFQHVALQNDVSYVGGDIVEPLILENQRKYGNAVRSFKRLDIIQDDLPAADVWMCRDCLFHLSNDDALAAIHNFLRSEIRYFLTTTHPDCERNADIPTGSFRQLNLRKPPFSFGEPLRLMDDWIEGFPKRQLGLWERTKLMQALAGNKTLRRMARRLS